MKKSEVIEKKKEFIDNIEKYCGIVTDICKAIGISYSTYYRWKKEDTEFSDMVEEKMAYQISFVESKLLNLIKNDNPSAIFFYLKCKAGYRENKEIKIDADKTFEIKIE